MIVKLTMAPLAAAALAAAGLWASVGMAHAEPEPTPPPGPKTTIDTDGTYEVGVDIQPGAYSSAGPIDGSACYWKRSSDGEMVDNALTKRPQVVTVEPTDTTFTTNDCQAWQLTDCSLGGCPPPPGPPPAALGPILQILGPQINQLGPPPPASPPPPPPG